MAKPKAKPQVQASQRIPLSTIAYAQNGEHRAKLRRQITSVKQTPELTFPRTRDTPRASPSGTCCGAYYRHSRYLAPTRTAIDALIADNMKMETFIMM
jgi:hypothetical protein